MDSVHNTETMTSTPTKTTVDLYRSLPSIKNQRLKFTSDDPFTPAFVKSRLTQSSDPLGIYESRVKGRQMPLENPARESRLKKERLIKAQRKRAAREKANFMGTKAARQKGLWKLDEAYAKYTLFLPLHHLWLGYMSELLSLSPPPPSSSSKSAAQAMPNADNMQSKLLKADFHGSIITVRESKNPSLVGLSGIVIHETENAFKVITKKDTVKLIPKQNSIFTFGVPLYSTMSSGDQAFQAPSQMKDDLPITTVLDKPHIAFDLYGNQFRFRAADRASRKFKPKETIEL